MWHTVWDAFHKFSLMKRPITVKFEDQILMFTVDIQRKDENIVYHLEHDSTFEKFRQDLPEDFNLLKQQNSAEIRYENRPLTDRGQHLAEAIWKVLEAHPPQFKGEEKEMAKAL